jgi:uncharacterized protein YebE (UPF0316 family)
MNLIAEFLSGSSHWVYIFIFFGKLTEVALASLRQQLIIKGHRFPGAVVALFEYTFWLCITASALSGFSDDPLKVAVLICAFPMGHIIGSYIEEKMALGFCSLSAIFMDRQVALAAAEQLRERGQALTIISAEGLKGAGRTAIVTAARRRDISTIQDLLFSADPEVVITVQAAQQVKGATIAECK